MQSKGVEDLMSRHDDAFDVRKDAAKIAHDRNFANNHPDNGEERAADFFDRLMY
jgi:hypothetical protein